VSLERTIRERAARAEAGPRRRWGQNFLVNAAVLDAIAEAAVPPGDAVLEIGPGPGTLTERLSGRAALVVAIERDPRWAEFLRGHFADARHVHIVRGDAVTLDWTACLEGRPPGAPVHLAGNLPYNLSGPLLIRAWKLRDVFHSATLMLQAEVAERLVAPPGSKSYGSLSVLFERAGGARRVRRVPAGAFWPPPKVDSAVVRLTFDRRLSADEGDRLERVVRAAFGQRRKTLRNALGARFGRAAVASLATEIDLTRRAETLSGPEFAWLAERLGPGAEPPDEGDQRAR